MISICRHLAQRNFKVKSVAPNLQVISIDYKLHNSTQGSINIIADSGFEAAAPAEDAQTTQEDEITQAAATESENNAHTSEESTLVANERRDIFHQWSESEIHIRDEYTKLLNDSNISALELDERKREYLNFVDNRNKKCGQLSTKITTNINSDALNLNFEESEISSLKCHIEEILSALIQTKV